MPEPIIEGINTVTEQHGAVKAAIAKIGEGNTIREGALVKCGIRNGKRP